MEQRNYATFGFFSTEKLSEQTFEKRKEALGDNIFEEEDYAQARLANVESDNYFSLRESPGVKIIRKGVEVKISDRLKKDLITGIVGRAVWREVKQRAKTAEVLITSKPTVLKLSMLDPGSIEEARIMRQITAKILDINACPNFPRLFLAYQNRVYAGMMEKLGVRSTKELILHVMWLDYASMDLPPVAFNDYQAQISVATEKDRKLLQLLCPENSITHTVQEDVGRETLLQLLRVKDVYYRENFEKTRRLLMFQMLFSVHQLHAKLKLIHKDVQMENFVLSQSKATWKTYYSLLMSNEQKLYRFFDSQTERTNSPYIVKMIDFETTEKDLGKLAGFPTTNFSYRAPEQIWAAFDNVSDEHPRVTKKMDIFSLGLIFADMYMIPYFSAFYPERARRSNVVGHLITGAFLEENEGYAFEYNLVYDVVKAFFKQWLEESNSSIVNIEDRKHTLGERAWHQAYLASLFLLLGVPRTKREMGFKSEQASSYVWTNLCTTVRERLRAEQRRINNLPMTRDAQKDRARRIFFHNADVILGRGLISEMLASKKFVFDSSSKTPSSLNPRVAEMIVSMLKWNPEERATAQDLLKSRWFDSEMLAFDRTMPEFIRSKNLNQEDYVVFGDVSSITKLGQKRKFVGEFVCCSRDARLPTSDEYLFNYVPAGLCSKVRCSFCLRPETEYKCSACNKMKYCNSYCQQLHWHYEHSMKCNC